MNSERQREILQEILVRAEALLEAGDPLIRGQYMHLAGRVSAMLAIVEAGLPRRAGET